MSQILKCSVRDGSFVEPCQALADNVDNPASAFSRAKGVTRWAYTNLRTHKPTRTFFGVKTRANPNGMLFNFCPWCGEDISAPFVDKDEPAA